MSQWEVARASGLCVDCGRQFVENEEFYAVLVEHADAFERVDHCLECWPKVSDQGLIFWKCRVPVRQEKKKTFVDDAVLVEVFRRLAEDPEAGRRRFLFVLTLVMMRKRLVKYVKALRREGREFWRVMLMDDRKEYLVLDPQLTEEQIAEMSAQLGQILSEDLPEEPGAEDCTQAGIDRAPDEEAPG